MRNSDAFAYGMMVGAAVMVVVLLLSHSTPANAADPTIHGHNGTQAGVSLPANGAYTIRHWESGQTYQRRTTQGRTVTVPHTDGTLIVRNSRGYRVALSEIENGWSGDADQWATTDRLDEVDTQIHRTADDLQRWSQDQGVRMDRQGKRMDHQGTQLRHHGARLDRHTGRLDLHDARIRSNSQRLDRHAAGIAGTAALASHSLSGPGLRVSVAGGAFAGHSAVSTAIGYGGEMGAVSVRYARSGNETVYGGAVEWRVW